ncbi:MAG: glycosyltransferase [Candidatus Glassbacteria bacterium]
MPRDVDVTPTSESWPPVTIIVVNYNGQDVIEETLDSIFSLQYPNFKVVVVDDGSEDLSLDIIRRNFKDVLIIEMGANTKRTSLVRNAGLRASDTDLVMFLDNDIRLEKNCLTRLVESWRELEDAVILTPRLMYAGEAERIYTDGQRIHYTAQSIAPRRDSIVNNSHREPEHTGGGGIFLLDKRCVDEIGGFDEAYHFGWGDDGEYFRRIFISGFGCYHITDAIGYHVAKERTTERAFAHIYNRWRFILITYSTRTIILLIPALIVYELTSMAFLLIKGSIKVYFNAAIELISSFRNILEMRGRVQMKRKRSDRSTLDVGEVYAPDFLKSNKLLLSISLLLNSFYTIYWKIAKPFLED